MKSRGGASLDPGAPSLDPVSYTHLDVYKRQGGGSDGNFTAAMGVPTLDGMGAVGEGAHASHESVVLKELIPRTALLAEMIRTI